MNEIFSLDGNDFIPLCNLLKVLGWCDSGAMAKAVIDDGNVTVNGQVEVRKRCKIVAGQEVQFNGQTVSITE